MPYLIILLVALLKIMQYHPNAEIEMTNYQANYQANTAPLFAKPAAKFGADDEEDEEPAITRMTGNIIWFWVIVIFTTAIPFINLLLFFVQPF